MKSMDMAAEETKRFVVRNSMEELPLFAEKVEALVEHWGFAGPLVMNLNLVLEEALVNIIGYGFPDNDEHKIKVSITRGVDRLTIRIIDDGIPFDPTAAEPPDISLPAGERPIGGLGILLISQLMDEVQYARIKEQNILTLTKYT